MSVWKNWLTKRRFIEGLGDDTNPADKFKFNTDDDDFGEDYERVQSELFKVIINKYPDEAMDFFNTIAGRGDEEVASLLRKLRTDKSPRLPRQPQHPTDGDEVVPSTADTGHNPEFSGN
jgi:hypothetical protein